MSKTRNSEPAAAPEDAPVQTPAQEPTGPTSTPPGGGSWRWDAGESKWISAAPAA